MASDPPRPSNAPAKATAAALAIAAAVAGVASFTASKEGEVHHAYRDAGGRHVATYCIGETQHVDWNKIYTHDECQTLFRKRLAADYAPKVLACVPGFIDRPKPFQAALDASYNSGWGAFCRSPMSRAFNAGQWAKGCDAFLGWYTTAAGVKLRGLVMRREGERLLCRG